MLANVRIVLVRPIRPGNVGAICRAMTNLGLADIAIVAPDCDIHAPEAQGFTARAKPLLQAAVVYPDIPSAIQDCVLTYAASGKGGVYRRQAADSARVAAQNLMQTTRMGRVAVAFGPEDRGLLLDELLHFDRVLEIPTSPDYPAMNLAAAATVVCYELYQAALATTAEPAEPRHGEDEPPATDERKHILLEQLYDALDRIGFFRGQQRENHLQFALRRVVGKAALTQNECDVLLGMARQINWYVDQHKPHPAARQRDANDDASRTPGSSEN